MSRGTSHMGNQVAPLYFQSSSAALLLQWISNLLHILSDFTELKTELQCELEENL